MNESTDPAIPVTELLARRVSCFASVHETCPLHAMTVGGVLDAIRNGRWREPMEAMRADLREGRKDAYKAKKEALPAVTFAGEFDRRRNDGLRAHSGLLCVDFDDLGTRLPVARRTVEADSHVLAVFGSPSDNGLKVLVPIAATDAEGHRRCFDAAAAHFRGLGFEADPHCRDVARLCFVSCDSDLWIRQGECVPFLGSSPEPETCTCTSELCTLSPVLYTTEEDPGIQELKAHAGAKRRLNEMEADSPVLVGLYRQWFVEGRYVLGAHKRNAWLTEAVPFLFRACHREVAEALALLHLRIHPELYAGTEDEHRTSFRCLWNGCEREYPSELGKREAPRYVLLEEPERTAFRICRDLARIQGSEPFFMGCDHLEQRLSLRRWEINGWRLLRMFEKLGFLRQMSKGDPYAKGKKANAGTYRWLLSDVPETASGTPTAAGMSTDLPDNDRTPPTPINPP